MIVFCGVLPSLRHWIYSAAKVFNLGIVSTIPTAMFIYWLNFGVFSNGTYVEEIDDS
jgi:hypothetical protein